MTIEEKYKEYIKDHCKRCKNRKTNKCNITISTILKPKVKCDYYEKED